MAEERKPELISNRYMKSRFFRFVLDTKEGEVPAEPRFKQFSENLRNYAVSAVVWKAAQTLPFTYHHPFSLIGRMILTVVAVASTVCCAAQQQGLLIFSSHWFIGWTYEDEYAIALTPNRRELLKIVGKEHLHRRAKMKLWGSLLITFLVVCSMLAFVFMSGKVG